MVGEFVLDFGALGVESLWFKVLGLGVLWVKGCLASLLCAVSGSGFCETKSLEVSPSAARKLMLI